MLRRKKEVLKFSGRNHSVKGILSVIIGSIVLLSFLTVSIISSITGGKGNIILGVVGILFFGVAIYGFILGVKSCREKEIYYTAPIIGFVLNGILAVIYLVLYLLGVFLL